MLGGERYEIKVNTVRSLLGGERYKFKLTRVGFM